MSDIKKSSPLFFLTNKGYIKKTNKKLLLSFFNKTLVLKEKKNSIGVDPMDLSRRCYYTYDNTLIW